MIFSHDYMTTEDNQRNRKHLLLTISQRFSQLLALPPCQEEKVAECPLKKKTTPELRLPARSSLHLEVQNFETAVISHA